MVLIADGFRIQWERDRERREIAELEPPAAMLLILTEQGWPTARNGSRPT
jgi:hypothetical protein